MSGRISAEGGYSPGLASGRKIPGYQARRAVNVDSVHFFPIVSEFTPPLTLSL